MTAVQLRDSLVVAMISAQVGLAVVGLHQGNVREATVTSLLALTNFLIFWR